MKPYPYLLLLVALSTLVSCTKENGEDPNAPVGLDARVAGVSLVTRGGASAATDIATLGIYAVNQDVSEQSYGIAPVGAYCAYKMESGNASPQTSGTPLWLCLDKAVIFSCHPAAAVTSGGTPSAPNPFISIPANAITLVQNAIPATASNIYDFASPANDYMYGVAWQNPDTYSASQPVADNGHTSDGSVTNQSGPTVSIGLKHAFAQMKLIIAKSTDYPGTAKITKVDYTRTMKTLATNGSSTMSLRNGALAELAAAAKTTYSFPFDTNGAITTESGNDKKPVTLINYVLPNDASTSTEITVTVDNKPMKITHTSDPEWEAGAIYTYTVTINPTGLELTGFNVVRWDDDTTQPGNVDIK